MLNFLMNHISSKTIFLFLTTKLFFWSLGMILFQANFSNSNSFFSIGDFWITKYLMFGLSIIGFLNLFKLHYRQLYAGINLLYCFLWTYVMVGYGFTSNFVGALVFRNLAELLFLIYMMYGIHTERDFNEKTLRNINSDNKKREADKNEIPQSLG